MKSENTEKGFHFWCQNMTTKHQVVRSRYCVTASNNDNGNGNNNGTSDGDPKR